jgi:tyrosine-protein phosphatase SIW14
MKITWTVLAVATFALLTGSSELSAAAGPAGGIPEFHNVTDQIYRGGRPYQTGLRYVASLNVKLDIDLEDDSSAIRSEEANAQRLGLEFMSEPMNAGRRPDDAQVDRILAKLQDPGSFPIFIHCKHGQDRTGLIIGLYRVLVEKWTPQKAYQEMLDIGFHPEYRALDDYFKDRTGYNPGALFVGAPDLGFGE